MPDFYAIILCSYPGHVVGAGHKPSCRLTRVSAADLIQRMPILSDPAFMADVHQAVTSAEPWQSGGLKAVVQFAWAIALRLLSQCPLCPGD